MKRIYRGKTKDLFLWSGDRLMIRFKDDLTGTGESPDPGGNEVVGSLAGKGSASLALSVYFFEFLERAGVATHYIERGPDEESLIVKKAQSFNLEVICREKAWGSFLRRYGSHIAGGEPLPSLVEFTLKDDRRGDPPICKETLAALNIALPAEIDYMERTARRITALISEQLARKGLELIDIKYEFGKAGGKILLIDEISGDTMRVLRGGRVLSPEEPAALILD